MIRQTAAVGYYCSLIAFLAMAGYGAVQILQVVGWLHYPVADRLIYGSSLAIAPPFLLAMLALHELLPADRRFWSHAALLFSLLYTFFVVLMYGVQLATVIPASLRDARPTLLTVTPHSLFWTIDALGYICMGIATLFAAFALKPGQDEYGLWLQRLLRANGLTLPLICVAYFYPHFSTAVLLIASPWLVTAPGSMIAMTLFFKKQVREI